MAPYTNIPLSPAELSFLRASLTQDPPIRPDGRSPTHFRPLVAERDILPTANGSARVCFADGSEAVVGVKVEVEKSRVVAPAMGEIPSEGVLGLGNGSAEDVEMDEDDDRRDAADGEKDEGEDSWLEISIEIPGMRDDDPLPIFLSAMLTEALLADGGLKDKLWINRRFHWRLYMDVLLLSQALSYPLPLLSLTTHLALLSTRIPTLVSEKDEDPLFNDDWEASRHLFPSAKGQGDVQRKPPVTLLVMSVDENVIFDPSKEELAVADAVVAISVGVSNSTTGEKTMNTIAIRTVDPPSRLTGAGVPAALNTTAGGNTVTTSETLSLREKDQGKTVWRPPRGGMKRTVVSKMIKMAVEEGGVGQEVLAGLAAVGS